VDISWEAFGATHVGRVRKGNEDAFLVDPDTGLFIVADGMGGHAAGEVASRIAVEAVAETVSNSDLRSFDRGAVLEAAFAEAFNRLVECCRDDPSTEGMGTTLTIALLCASGSLHIGHLGDSRLYLLRGSELRHLTRDHTWVQQEIEAGRVEASAARTHPLAHILTRVLSAEEPANPEVHLTSVTRGDTLLLCSDGLHNMLDHQTLLDLLVASEPLETVVGRLISSANRRGGVDNITAIVVRVR
jgi:PPM family protein phosphatase